jgi:acid phosphatase (class A)
MKPSAKTVALLLLICGVVHADQPPLFRPGLIDAIKLLPTPAALDTEEMKAELQTVLRVQETRTDKDIERARDDEKIRTESFQSALGPWATAEKLPRLQALFKRMEKEAKVHSNAAKNHFKRGRPLTADSRVKPLFEEPDPGYPSGHSLRGQMFALLLAELAPDKTETLLARGREIGWSRVIGGVHFPSDVNAGRTLGQALAREMLANPAFRMELEEVRKEFEAARQGKPPAAVSPDHKECKSTFRFSSSSSRRHLTFLFALPRS